MTTRSEQERAHTPDRAHPPQPAPLRPYDFPDVRRASLASGVPVIAAQVDALPVVTVHVILPAGAVTEEPSLAGLAALTCALLDAGAAGRSATEIAEAIESLGVDLDAGASWDAAYLSLTALRSRLEPALDLLTDLIRNPDFPGAEVERLQKQRLAEILQRRSDPRSLATEAVARFIYADESPFSRALGGIRTTVERITRSDIVSFHAHRFHAGGTAVIGAGDVSIEELTTLLDRRFGDWGGAPEYVARPSSSARSKEPRVVIVDRPGAVQSEIRVGHLGVARSTNDYFPLVVTNAVLGGMFSSRLNLNLRERHGYTYGAHSGFSMRRDPGAFVVSTAVQTETTELAIREIFTELRRIREAPATDAELTDARRYIAGTFPLRLQTTDGIAARLADLALHDLGDDYYDTYRERIVAVDADSAFQAAVRHIRPDEAVVVVVGDAARLAEPLGGLEAGPIQVVSPESLDDRPA